MSISNIASNFVLVAASTLFVSEPHPSMFGNPREQNLQGWSNANWLKSRFHFSFAEYYSRERERFGPLRVLNDDLVQPKRGFGAHPHRDMEIVTYIVHGELTHKDSMGTAESLGRGAVQYMSAGTGVTHSEHNLGDTPLRFLQIWIVPRRRGLKPNYGSYTTNSVDRLGRWCPIVGDVERSAGSFYVGAPAAMTDDEKAKLVPPVRINQDVTISVAELDKSLGHSVTLDVQAGRQAYLVCVEGSVTGAPSVMQQHDAAMITGPATYTLAPEGDKAHLLVLDMFVD